MTKKDPLDMQNLLEHGFASGGARRPRPEPAPDCPSAEGLASYLDAGLSATDRRSIEDHALTCADCHTVLKATIDLRGLPASVPSSLSIVARLVRKGLELLNPLEVTLRSLVDGPAPALGAARGTASAELPPSEVISVEGPGMGLDEVQIHLQQNGQIRLQVRGDGPPPLHPGEVSSVVLEVDGAPREKRPYSGDPLAFASLGCGHFRVRLVARAPGCEARELSEAAIELRG